MSKQGYWSIKYFDANEDLVCKGEAVTVTEAEGELQRLARYVQKKLQEDIREIMDEPDFMENQNEVAREKVIHE